MPHKDPVVRKAYEKRLHQTPEWREKNRKWQRAFRARGGKQREYQRLKANPEKYKARIKRQRVRRWEVKLEALQLYGGACECCGETLIAFLTFDHINRDGKAHRQKVATNPCGSYNSYKFHNWLLRQGGPVEDIRVLCMNCNFATRFGDPCPHQA